jgi:hypothetical protein
LPGAFLNLLTIEIIFKARIRLLKETAAVSVGTLQSSKQQYVFLIAGI